MLFVSSQKTLDLETILLGTTRIGILHTNSCKTDKKGILLSFFCSEQQRFLQNVKN